MSDLNQLPFRFKAHFSPCLIFELLQSNLDNLQPALAKTVASAPNFFMNSLVVIDLEKLAPLEIPNFATLVELLTLHNMVLVGVRNGSKEQLEAAAQAGLPLVKAGKAAKEIGENYSSMNTEGGSKKLLATKESKVITTPIRSGMQVCANGDLIVVAPVSSGAEIVADGHIHVYGILRGRALAGAHGNKEARIFCHSLDADLIAIAGYYLTKEEIQSMHVDLKMVQIYLENERLCIKKL